MSDVEAKFEPYFMGGGEDGTAYYCRNADNATWAALEDSTRDMGLAVDKVPFNAREGRPFVVADYGCQDGGVSATPFQHIIENVRKKHGSTVDVLILYEDQPYGDFKSLFLLANGIIVPKGAQAWTQQKGVYFAAAGRSFYEQCFPNNSVHIGLSSQAVHFLSKRPCPVTYGLHYSLSPDANVKKSFARQAAADWEAFLLLRCKELVPGGRLIVLAFYATDDGEESDIRKEGHNLYRMLSVLWRQLYLEGRINQDELDGANYNFYMGTLAELKSPFLREDSVVVQAGIRLVSFAPTMYPNVLKMAFQKNALESAAVATDLVPQVVQSIRSWGSGPFLIALSSKPDAEKRAIVKELFRRFEAEVRTNPTRFLFNHPRVTITVRKVSE